MNTTHPFLGKSTFANSFCAVLQGKVIAKSCVWQVTVREAQLNTLLWTFQTSEKWLSLILTIKFLRIFNSRLWVQKTGTWILTH
jgi:hypothetical protein